ncbi:MAG: hypothetical protein QNL91_07900 [Candidatus Krumholzibacteria bacterium]|nr:hypothetical protein [Candidatus Krumholzibacteria bacterium]
MITSILGIQLVGTIIPAPDALPLPAPAPVLFFLLQLTFLLHLLAMNALLGGLIITLVARLRGKGPDDPWTQLADSIAKTSPSLVAATVNLGVAPLLFLQTLMGQFFFTSSILMGWGWFSVVVVLIFAYYGTYLQSFKGSGLGRLQKPILAVTVLLFLWVAFMFSNNNTLMLQTKQWAGMYFNDARGLHLNLGDPQLWPRYLHMVLGAVAVAGLMLAWWGRVRHMRGDERGAFMVRVGINNFTWVTLVNILVGLWFFMALPSDVRKLFMGGDPGASAMFGIGFVLAIGMFVLGFLARLRGPRVRLVMPTAMTIVQMIVMITMRDVVRNGYLGELYRPAEFAVKTQTLNLVIFGVLLVGGVLTVIWMVRRLYLGWENS